MISVNFNVESPQSARERLTKGYRARRNFAIYTLMSMIVEQTPVKTGLARGNWQIGIAVRPVASVLRRDPVGDMVVYEELGKLRGASAFAKIYIVNNLTYIGDLEEGSSTQAPQGIIRVVMPAFRAMNRDVI